MATVLRMPEVAANAVEAILQAWPVPVNTPYAKGDVIATIETEKAVVEVEADSAGVILRTLVEEGATVRVGTPIAITGTPGEPPTDLDTLLPDTPTHPTPPAQPPVAQPQVAQPQVAQPPVGQTPAGQTPVDQAAMPSLGGPPPEPGSGDAGRTGRRVFTSPLARRLAKEAGLRIEEISGTGPNGRIIRKDVEAAIAAQPPAPAPTSAPTSASAPTHGPVPTPAPAPTPGLVPTPAPGSSAPGTAVPVPGTGVPAPALAGGGGVASVPGATSMVGQDAGRAVVDVGSVTGVGRYVEVPHSRMRRAIAARLTESKRTAPHFYLRGTARVDALLALRAQLNDGADLRISVNDLVVKAAAHAHVLVPAMNVTWTDTAVRAYTEVDIAVAVATPGGLVTPVLRAVERTPVSVVSARMREYGERARAGRLRQDELDGGTLTVTNLGMYGTEEFAAIVNPPQAAILAVGAARQEAVVEDGRVVVATVMAVTLSVDHRPVDGVVAADWMRTFLALLENPVRILV